MNIFDSHILVMDLLVFGIGWQQWHDVSTGELGYSSDHHYTSVCSFSLVMSISPCPYCVVTEYLKPSLTSVLYWPWVVYCDCQLSGMTINGVLFQSVPISGVLWLSISLLWPPVVHCDWHWCIANIHSAL